METEKVIVDLTGEKVPFIVPGKEELLYVNARDILQDRLAVLKNKYASSASINQLMTALAVEATVDALKLEDSYKKLKNEVETRLDTLKTNLSD